ncbi:MAG: hypothetical protein FJX28_01715 [Alphaproteobacteria bacterium]|nr:hypothetical protein [Alphaproteobacteria bacterium]
MIRRFAPAYPGLAAATLAPARPALAHTGEHGASDLMHLVTEPDHLAMIALGLALVVLVAVKLWGRS